VRKKKRFAAKVAEECAEDAKGAYGAKRQLIAVSGGAVGVDGRCAPEK